MKEERNEPPLPYKPLFLAAPEKGVIMPFKKGNTYGIGNKHNIGKIPWNKGMKFPNRPKKPTKKEKCLDCGKEIHKTSKRCRNCSKKLRNRNPLIKQKRWALKVNGVYLTSISSRIRDLKEYSQWRSDVFNRDMWTCQTCGKRGIKIEAHHIISFSKILFQNKINSIDKASNCIDLWDINNGVTLCIKCHMLTKKGSRPS